MSENLDLSYGSLTYVNTTFDDTPCHSTPKTSIDEQMLMSQHYTDVVNRLQFNLQQNNCDADSTKNCNSTLSASSKDSGRHSNSSNEIESTAALKLIQELVIHAQKLEQTVDYYKKSNYELQSRMKDMNIELKTLRRSNKLESSIDFKDDQLSVTSLLKTENSLLVNKLRDAENDVRILRNSENDLRKEVETWRKNCNEAWLEVEATKGTMETEKAKALQQQEQMKRKLNEMKKLQKTLSQPPSHSREHVLQERLNIALNTLKTLLRKQDDVVGFCLSSLVPSFDLTHQLTNHESQNLNRLSEFDELEALFGKLLEDEDGNRAIRPLSQSASDERNDASKRWDKSARKKTERAYSLSKLKDVRKEMVDDETKRKQESSSKQRQQVNDEVVRKLNRLLATSRKIRSLMSHS